MKMKIPWKIGTGLISCFIIMVIIGTQDPLKSFIHSFTRPTDLAAGIRKNAADAELRQWIKKIAKQRNQPAINAVMDPTWKVIPGYNGQMLDIEATYLKAKLMGALSHTDQGFPWIYRSVKPKVTLQNFPNAPIYRGNPAKPVVGLMINVAWGEKYLPPILATLKRENVKATFFFDGSWLREHLSTARMIIAAGHEASNHAYSHPNMRTLGVMGQTQEIAQTQKILTQLGVKNVWFAPPSGEFNGTTIKVTRNLGLRTVLWTLDTIDWRKPLASMVVSKVKKKVSPGTLILMHPTLTTVNAMSGILKAIKQKGLKPSTVASTLSMERVAAE